MTLLQMSIQAGLLITATVIIRFIALNKLPKTFFLVLWGAALVRMLVPFCFSWKWSVYSIVGGIMDRAGEDSAGTVKEITTIFDKLSPQQLAITTGQNTHIPLSPVIAVWLIVMAALAVISVLWLFRSYRELRFAIPFEQNALIDKWRATHKLFRPLNILRSDRITTPLAVGIIRPRIILPKTMDVNAPQVVQYVLTHEYFHICRFDMLWKLLMLCAVCIHWFNPLAWVMLVFLNRDLEITCDELVLRHFGGNTNEKEAYACSLIGMAEAKGKFSPINSYFSRNFMEERIVSIMKYQKTSVLAIIAAAVMVMCLTTVAFATSESGKTLQDVNGAIRAAEGAAHPMELLDSTGNSIYVQAEDNESFALKDVGDSLFFSEEIDCVSGITEQHVEANGHMAVYRNNGGTWRLKAGQAVTLIFDVAASSNEDNGWSIDLGYGKDGAYVVCSSPRISSGETVLTLTVPEDGEYHLFFVNASAGAIFVNRCEIMVD